MELKPCHEAAAVMARMSAFNRTSMELKQLAVVRFAIVVVIPTFNRTSMELKPVDSARLDKKSRPFNRTSMELKLHIGIAQSGGTGILLIEPAWN